MEIRHLPGIGKELRCPVLDSGGGKNPWYDLVDEVRPGDVVYHWNAKQHRFVGRSFAVEEPKLDGSERVVELSGFLPINADISLSHIRSLEDKIVRIRGTLQSQYPEVSLYLPIQFRRDGLRMMSNYFAVLPKALVNLLFGPDGIGEQDAEPPPEEDGPAESPDRTEVRGFFLQPFKPKADIDYLVRIQGRVSQRGRDHERLVNRFSKWLQTKGFEVGYSSAIDIGLEEPPVIIEVKMVRSWPTAIRQAVSQLYEYRYFQIVDPDSQLLFLASHPVPDEWLAYLENDRMIGVAWYTGDGFQLGSLAESILFPG